MIGSGLVNPATESTAGDLTAERFGGQDPMPEGALLASGSDEGRPQEVDVLGSEDGCFAVTVHPL